MAEARLLTPRRKDRVLPREGVGDGVQKIGQQHPGTWLRVFFGAYHRAGHGRHRLGELVQTHLVVGQVERRLPAGKATAIFFDQRRLELLPGQDLQRQAGCRLPKMGVGAELQTGGGRLLTGKVDEHCQGVAGRKKQSRDRPGLQAELASLHRFDDKGTRRLRTLAGCRQANGQHGRLRQGFQLWQRQSIFEGFEWRAEGVGVLALAPGLARCLVDFTPEGQFGGGAFGLRQPSNVEDQHGTSLRLSLIVIKPSKNN